MAGTTSLENGKMKRTSGHSGKATKRNPVVKAPPAGAMSRATGDDRRSDRLARGMLTSDENDQLAPRGVLLDETVDRDGKTEYATSHGSVGKASRARIGRILGVVAAFLPVLMTVAFAYVASMTYVMSPANASSAADSSSENLTRTKITEETPRVSIDYTKLSEMFESSSSGAKDYWRDNLIYIQWAARPEACWPIPGGSMSQKVECGSVAWIMGTILLTGDYTITPDIMLANMERKYGPIAPNQGFSLFQRYSEEVYGIHNKSIGHISAEQAKEILDEGHLMIVGMGCENNPNGVPFCKAKGVPPRCCHGHTVLLYKYDDGYFYVKNSAPSDGASMCLYPEGPLTVTHQGAMDGQCAQNGKTVTYDNYADAWLRNGWVWDVWADHPAKGPTAVPPSVPEPEAWKKDKQE